MKTTAEQRNEWRRLRVDLSHEYKIDLLDDFSVLEGSRKDSQCVHCGWPEDTSHTNAEHECDCIRDVLNEIEAIKKERDAMRSLLAVVSDAAMPKEWTQERRRLLRFEEEQ